MVNGRPLRPAFGGVFPAYGSRRLWHRIGRWLRDADRLLRRQRRSHCLAIGYLGDRLFVFRKQRSRYPQRLHFFFQSRQFQFFLSQDLVNIFHCFRHLDIVHHVERSLCTLAPFVKKHPCRKWFPADLPAILRISVLRKNQSSAGFARRAPCALLPYTPWPARTAVSCVDISFCFVHCFFHPGKACHLLLVEIKTQADTVYGVILKTVPQPSPLQSVL